MLIKINGEELDVAEGSTIQDVKVISATTVSDIGTTYGELVNAGGVVAGITNATAGNISKASVESFANKKENGNPVYTLNGNTVYGLVNVKASANISLSFINAKINATTNASVYLFATSFFVSSIAS